MLRRLLMGTGKRLIDDNTVFFNDGTDFTDQSGNNIKVSVEGSARISSLKGETCWNFGYDNNKGFLCFRDNRLSLFYPSRNCKCIEFMVYNSIPSNMVNNTMFSYTNDTGWLAKLSIQGRNEWYYMIQCFSYGVGSSGDRVIAKDDWMHVAFEFEEDPNASDKIIFSSYCDGKFLGVFNQNGYPGNIENLFQYMFGASSTQQSGAYALNSGIKNVRFSNILRYKKKDYTPYVDN